MSSHKAFVCAVCVLAGLCQVGATGTGTTRGDAAMAFSLTSPAFDEGQAIPRKYTGEGQDISPPLSWSNPPDGVKSFALICDDPDAPKGTWVHWVAWNISPDTTSLPEGVPPTEKTDAGIVQGNNTWPKIGYGGPMPPPGPAHRYFFKLYALDTEIALKPGATKEDLVKAMQGRILGEAQLMGTYKR